MASEKVMRQTARQWTIDSIGVEMMPFTFPVKEDKKYAALLVSMHWTSQLG